MTLTNVFHTFENALQQTRSSLQLILKDNRRNIEKDKQLFL